jgi:anti-sigma factor RsiW
MSQIDRYACEETIRRLDDYLDRELPPHETQLVNEHLEVCAMCASEYTFEARALERLCDKVSRLAAPEKLIGLAKVGVTNFYLGEMRASQVGSG